ncbi:MAG: hypothetical protein JXA58_07715 [Dehalococcoidia bacterium]|nr:hypothetical protein [Dehalococcoidia bacterium]
MTRRFLLRVLLAFMTLGGGCQSLVSHGNDALIGSAVLAYNDALIHGFANLDMNELNRTATEEQAQREFYLMAALGESRVRMLSTLVEIEFGEVVVPAQDRAAVTTTEVWDYDHVSLDTSETVRSERGVVYHLEYELVLRDGRWLVDGVTSLDASSDSENDSAEQPAVPDAPVP